MVSWLETIIAAFGRTLKFSRRGIPRQAPAWVATGTTVLQFTRDRIGRRHTSAEAVASSLARLETSGE
jgi:hypothetical protein